MLPFVEGFLFVIIMDYGWIRLHRKALKSSVWKKPNLWRVWSWCLLKANHKANKFPFAGKDIIIKEGQFITGIKRANGELKLTTKKFRNAISYLKNSKRITTKTTNQFTIITVINWRKYQPLKCEKGKRNTGKRANEGQTRGKRGATNKKKKKKKDTNTDTNTNTVTYTKRSLELAKLLYKMIKDNNPAWYVKPNWDNWAGDIDKTIRLDKRTAEQVEWMINWVQNDSFWKQNILSPSKLREKFNTLVVKAKSNNRRKVI